MRHRARLERLERRSLAAEDDAGDIPVIVVDFAPDVSTVRAAATAPRKVDYRRGLHLIAPLEGGEYAEPGTAGTSGTGAAAAAS